MTPTVVTRSTATTSAANHHHHLPPATSLEIELFDYHPRNRAQTARFRGWQLFSVSDNYHNHTRPPLAATRMMTTTRDDDHNMDCHHHPQHTVHTNNRLLRKWAYMLVFIGGRFLDHHHHHSPTKTSVRAGFRRMAPPCICGVFFCVQDYFWGSLVHVKYILCSCHVFFFPIQWFFALLMVWTYLKLLKLPYLYCISKKPHKLNCLNVLNITWHDLYQGFQPIPVNDIAYTSKFYLYKCDSLWLKFTEIHWKK